MKYAIILSVLTLVGCARFHTTQVDSSYDKGQLVRTITTSAGSTTFFDSQSALASFKASQSDKTQSASVGSLNQETSSTNSVAMLKAVAELISALPK